MDKKRRTEIADLIGQFSRLTNEEIKEIQELLLSKDAEPSPEEAPEKSKEDTLSGDASSINDEDDKKKASESEIEQKEDPKEEKEDKKEEKENQNKAPSEEPKSIQAVDDKNSGMEKAGVAADEIEAGKAEASKPVKRHGGKVLLALAVAATICGGAYYGFTHLTADRFPPGTYLNGHDVGRITVTEATDILEKEMKNGVIQVVWENGTIETIPISKLNCEVTTNPDIHTLAKTKSPLDWIVPGEHAANYTVTYTLLPERNSVLETVEQLDCVTGIGTIEPSDAYIAYEGGKYIIKDGDHGTRVDPGLLTDRIIDAVENGLMTVSLKEADCYASALITANDPSLTSIIKEVRGYETCELKLDLSGVIETLDWQVFGDWIDYDDTDNTFSLREEMVAEYVDSLAEKYDTYGKERSFKTTSGDQITVGGTDLDNYGFKLDREETTKLLIEKLKAQKSKEIKAVWEESGRKHGQDNDFGDYYIEVSIEKQHMWLISNGEIVLDTDVVTGLDTDGRRTPVGVFMILDKKKDYTMTGSYGSAYCNFCIAISHEGICIHDAPWRNNFGGSIYKNDGSHGCVNTPYDAMKALYENEALTNYGTPVIVY